MPTTDATLASSPLSLDALDAIDDLLEADGVDERGSSRRLDDVGVEAVLGAMIEQKRRSSRPSFPSFDLDLAPHEEITGVFVKAR